MVRSFQVDEASDAWVATEPAFRVILFRPDGQAWSVDTWEVSDCGVLDAIRWAQDHVEANGAWAVGLLGTSAVPETGEVRRGFTYIEGADLNVQATDRDHWEARQVGDMLARLNTPVIAPRLPA